jgi:hypothetical protein
MCAPWNQSPQVKPDACIDKRFEHDIEYQSTLRPDVQVNQLFLYVNTSISWPHGHLMLVIGWFNFKLPLTGNQELRRHPLSKLPAISATRKLNGHRIGKQKRV